MPPKFSAIHSLNMLISYMQPDDIDDFRDKVLSFSEKELTEILAKIDESIEKLRSKLSATLKSEKCAKKISEIAILTRFRRKILEITKEKIKEDSK